MKWVVVLALVSACGSNDPTPETDAPPPDVDAPPPDIDAPIDAPDVQVCPNPDECPWIEDHLRDVLAKLTGEREAAPGVLITRRASSAQRETTRQYLVAELTALGLTPTLHDYGSGKNVVVTLPSTTGATSPRIVIGAHFDGVAAGPAAADNGTGTAVVVVAARYLASRTRRDLPVDLVLFDQEEAGLIGSTAYALMMRDQNIVADSVHNVDMVSFDGDGDHSVELWSPTPALEAVYRMHGTARGIPVSAVPFSSSDHQSFLDRGYPTVGVCEEFVGGDATPHYHRVTDTYDKIDFTYLTRVTRYLLVIFEDRAVND